MEDVIHGKSDTMFLATSVHRILDHLTGKVEIAQESIDNFATNMQERSAYCADRGIPYRHVIYPDKITVMRSYFPIQDIRTFSDRYRHAYTDAVIDLADHLPASDEHFLRTDTHLNFLGKVETCLIVLKALNPALDVDEARELLMACRGDKYDMLGDLGSKVTPQQTETHYRIVNRSVVTFNNQVGANDGLTVMVFNKRMLASKASKRLLIFGDSFMERSLRLLGNFYSEILFCRTRYMHEEIAHMFQPDHMISSSAERYFSGVRLDRDASRFNLLYGLREHRYSDNLDFYKAYDAVLNPGSQLYKRFIHRIVK